MQRISTKRSFRRIFRRKKAFLFSYKFFLRFHKNYSSKEKSFFLVVTDSRGGIIDTVGFFNTALNFKPESYRFENFYYYRYDFKILGINFESLFYWFNKGIFPCEIVCFILHDLGVLKEYPKVFVENSEYKVKKKLELYHFLTMVSK